MYIRKSDFLKEDYFFYVHAALSSFHILSGIDGSLYGFQEKCQGKIHPEKIQKYSFFETAKKLYVPAALLDYKFSLLHEKGELVNSMYIRKSDFLREDLGDYDEANHF